MTILKWFSWKLWLVSGLLWFCECVDLSCWCVFLCRCWLKPLWMPSRHWPGISSALSTEDHLGYGLPQTHFFCVQNALVLPPRASMTDCSPWFVLSIEVARCSWKKAPRYFKFLHAVQVTPHSGSMMLRSSFRTIEGLVHYCKKLQAVIDYQGGMILITKTFIFIV